ncbi:hypothetical protein [Tamlana crocina]|uniref:hypothetical protein n=1 Tax=Tamlana crocina TaxID=393006 RepID=UPI003159474D
MLIKLSIVMAAFYFIYDKLTNNGALKFSDFWNYILKNGVFSTKTIILLTFLSGFNWFFEILKWKVLGSSVEKITLKQAAEQTLGSLTASLFTPNRIGEYGAKALYFPFGKRKQVMIANLTGNVLQMMATTVFGVIGLYFFINSYQLKMFFLKPEGYPFFGFLVIVLLGFLFFFRKKLTLKKFKISKKQLGFCALLSVIRYFIFSFQFFVLLQLFGVNLNYFEAMTIILSMYLLASVIPSIFVFDVLIKGSVAVFLFLLAGVNEVIVLSVVTIMWVFNFMLPSLLGCYFVLTFQPKRNTVSA